MRDLVLLNKSSATLDLVSIRSREPNCRTLSHAFAPGRNSRGLAREIMRDEKIDYSSRIEERVSLVRDLMLRAAHHPEARRGWWIKRLRGFRLQAEGDIGAGIRDKLPQCA